MSSEDALKTAKESNLDLVEVSPTSSPPVCRVMDFSRYKYEQEKREREARKHQKAGHLKEIRMKPKIEEHDYQFKLHHLERFLKRRDKAKVTMMFRGREMAHPELGRRVLDKLISDLSHIAEVERGPTREGRYIYIIFAPK